MRPSTLAVLAGLALATTAPALAQTAPAPPAVAAAPNPAFAADVASLDAIVAALYDVISGDAGEARDWDRMRYLFHPAAQLMPTSTNPQGLGVLTAITPQGYVDRAGPTLVRDGFHEREIARRVDRFGRIAHVFSTYDARRAATDAQPFLRGINSIQLFDDGARWWIVSVYWQAESPTVPLPPEYLPTP
ncbi:hypothetical protein [Brevundimonas aurifodinae]|uniref:Nuclear transport factor 2 family protein n=2 Tax=Brevundimonas TaxID=41275 RepID=A0ABV1NLU6_9CAUL|nr:MAG: hypothetical protein B7Z42_04860 [Brevundimonas sp. 12-68-7]OYX36126.1 MAG: hypothetical protein B7Z01_00275 [Brevundimonas subvibrioides]